MITAVNRFLLWGMLVEFCSTEMRGFFWCLIAEGWEETRYALNIEESYRLKFEGKGIAYDNFLARVDEIYHKLSFALGNDGFSVTLFLLFSSANIFVLKEAKWVKFVFIAEIVWGWSSWASLLIPVHVCCFNRLSDFSSVSEQISLL